MNMLDVFMNSRSYREYKQDCITKEQMETLIKAGRCAPSSNNEELWYFVGVMCKEKVDMINQAICEQHGDNKDHFHQAPSAIIVAIDPQATFAATSAAAATQNILLCAESLKLASCWIDGVIALNKSEKGPELKKEFNIPSHYEFYAGVSLGYRVSDLDGKELKPNRYTIVE